MNRYGRPEPNLYLTQLLINGASVSVRPGVTIRKTFNPQPRVISAGKMLPSMQQFDCSRIE